MWKVLGLAALVSGLAALPAEASFRLGLLDCAIEGGTGYVVVSNKVVTCKFRPSGGDYGPETYTGIISKLGVDLGVTDQGTLTWAVLAADLSDYGPGALAGTYLGANAEASLVTGGGANLLVGGSGRSFVLQPLSVQAQTGVNVAVGVASLELQSSLK